MKAIYILVIASLVTGGCAATQPIELLDKLPHLVEHEPFPPMPGTITKASLELDLRLQISEDGSVLKAELENSSGDTEWDSLAQLRLYKWRFTPAIYNSKPTLTWINIRAHVTCEDPIYLRLAEIVCPSASIADSVYALLNKTTDFGSLAARFSVSKSKATQGEIGQVDIHRYGDDVKRALARLRENEFTEPMALGNQFVIFKRLGTEVRIE